MSMTAQQRRSIQWGTVVSIAALAVAIGGGLWRQGGQIAVTQSIAVRSCETAEKADARSHDNQRDIAEMRAYQVTILSGLDEIKTELRALRK